LSVLNIAGRSASYLLKKTRNMRNIHLTSHMLLIQKLKNQKVTAVK